MTTAEQAKTVIRTGNQAAADGARLARVGVVCFFPIGPSDEVGEHLVDMINSGELDARVIDLENERSVVNAQITATQSGVRSTFSTNSEGLVFAYQPLIWSPYARVPIVVGVAHRSLEPPTNIQTDDHDTIIFRDSHWIQFYCENAQEVLDTMIQAYWVAERHDIQLPVFVTWPGWEVSHAAMPVEVPTQEQVDEFLPPYELLPGRDLLTLDMEEFYSNASRGGGEGASYIEQRYAIDHTLNVDAKQAILEAHERYVEVMGRGYGGLIESYMTEDAEVILVGLANMATRARQAADAMREQGKRVGVIKVRTLRPFPSEAIAEAVGNARVVMAFDRNPVHTLYHELRSALYSHPGRPAVLGRVVALAGRNFSSRDAEELVDEAFAAIDDPAAVDELSWRMETVAD
ncbi:MAG TPA: transketolase C-terminal domain-containing protein [Dehalococcoidia bacterium]|jgi:pyruvate/2-oxoacid:ferredoxin oxidoreductase alpha subunit|nr:transketolase C-terminal domain-containing protein [Dehalococcoidia bacterium]